MELLATLALVRVHSLPLLVFFTNKSMSFYEWNEASNINKDSKSSINATYFNPISERAS
ncbi:hypothetical protein EV198_0352 [Roseivirga ehrenbergii]|nr:hypothetical protein EV198_0352 [Roseivirga ehrenbergii]